MESSPSPAASETRIIPNEFASASPKAAAPDAAGSDPTAVKRAGKRQLETTLYVEVERAITHWAQAKTSRQDTQEGVPKEMVRVPSPEVRELQRSEVIDMRWKRLLSKARQKLANCPSSESFGMPEDMAPQEAAAKRGREVSWR